MAKRNNTKPIVGKYILDTLSTGMYNNPLMVIREYIQNSVDAIDDIVRKKKLNKAKGKVEIVIDWKHNSMIVSDNGSGIPAKDAYSTLTNLGKSKKSRQLDRGFRGIGRLGGLSYCDKLIFKTKAKGESKYSESIWDCNKLRSLINNKEELDVTSLVNKATIFTQKKYKQSSNDHFFIVEMQNLKSSRDILLDVPSIKAYLSQAAPVPFNTNRFSFAADIEERLRMHVPNYKAYKIIVNDEQIFKPYTDTVKISDKRTDKIKDIDFIPLSNGNGTLAFGWLANLELQGVINRSSLTDGIRVRCGNIMIGDKNLLSNFYKEQRFNNYLIGEIHIVEHELIPNSRRDDFEDNQYSEDFYACFLRKIGLPYSLKIREASSLRSVQQKKNISNETIAKAKELIKRGFYSELQKTYLLGKLKNLNGNNGAYTHDYISDLTTHLEKSKHYFDLLSKKLTPSKKKTLMVAFDIIYSKAMNKNEAEEIIESIINLNVK